MKRVFFDLETVPNQDGKALKHLQEGAKEAKAKIQAPRNYKDPEKIAEYVKAKEAEIDEGIHNDVLKTSFDGALGHIAVVGFAIDNEKPNALFFDSKDPSENEAALISQFYKTLSERFKGSSMMRPTFVGHNIVNFDLLFLFQRSVVLGIKPPPFIPFDAKPWDDSVYDTMTRWAGVRGSISMDKLAKALGLPGKTGVDGSQVWPLISAGKIREVADYCANTDVEQARSIWRRMNFLTLPTPKADD